MVKSSKQQLKINHLSNQYLFLVGCLTLKKYKKMVFNINSLDHESFVNAYVNNNSYFEELEEDGVFDFLGDYDLFKYGDDE